MGKWVNDLSDVVAESWYDGSIKFIEEKGMNEYLNALLISDLHRLILYRIKERYPKEKLKIELWEILHPE